MSAVVTFWQLPDEEEEFLCYLESTGTVLALPDYWVKKREDLCPISIRAFIANHNPDQLLFGLQQYLHDVPVEERLHEGEVLYVGPSAMESCLISYRRGKMRNDHMLGQSNLAAYWTHLNKSNSSVIDKEADFTKWGKKVLAWARKYTPEWHDYKGYRATKRAKEALAKGVVKFVP